MWFKKYEEAKEKSKNRRLEKYKEDIINLAIDIEEALEKGNDFIFDNNTTEYKTSIASKLGFNIEYHNWGNYIYFNKFGIRRLQRKLKKFNLESKGDE